MNKKALVVILLLPLLVGFLIGLSFTYFAKPVVNIKPVEKEKPIQLKKPSLVRLDLPAVNPKGEGVLAQLEVEVIPGDGDILTNIENIYFFVDTQDSIRIARKAAVDYLNISPEHYDFIYSIRTNATVVGGPSAGAAIALSTIAALQKKSLPTDTLITGSISENGKIGPVGLVFKKAKAAQEAGYKLFLVPEGQATQLVFEREESCHFIGTMEICTINYKPREVSLYKELEIEIKEVSTIEEVAKAFGISI